jgi:SET domain-containing protein
MAGGAGSLGAPAAVALMPASYRSPKTEVRPSPIQGRGLFARRPIARGEIVAIKGGHILDRPALDRVRPRVADSYVQIADGFYIGARTRAEVRRNKLYLNHSCAPNLGLMGQIAFVALRPIPRGEELTYDWAMEENRAARLRCRCGATRCRGTLTGQDWRQPGLQRKYRGYFSPYLAAKMKFSKGRAHQPRQTRARAKPRRSRRAS